jgi:hypothetical protein
MARTGHRRGAYRVLVVRPKGKRPLGRPMCRWQDITMDLQEVEWRGMDWIDVVQDRNSWGALLNAVMTFRVA